MVRLKNETEALLPSITEKCETLIKQTHRKAEETLEIKLNKSKETFHFNPPIQIDGSWMVGFIGLEVYNSVFTITEENNKFELYRNNFEEFSFEELKDELQDILYISDNTPLNLQHEKKGPHINEAYQMLWSQKSSTVGYFILLMQYARSPFWDFENYLRIGVGLDEEDNKLIWKQYNSNFVTYDFLLGIYTIKDLSESVYTIGAHEGTLQIDYDDISMRTKLILYRFEGTFGTLRLYETSFFITLLGFTPFWDYTPTKAIHAESPGVYTSGKILYLGTKGKIHLKRDCINGSSVSGIRESILFSFVLDKLSWYKIFCEAETFLYKKNKLLNTISFYTEDSKNRKVYFKQEVLTFTLQKFKIWTFKWAVKILKVIPILWEVDIDLLQQKIMVT